MEREVLLIKDRIQTALETGESHFREFKSAVTHDNGIVRPRYIKDICKDIAETLVGFANADGGELLIGVEDDSSVTGIPHNEEELRKMLDAPKTHVHIKTPLKTYKLLRVDFKDKVVLYFQTEKSAETIHLTSDGRCLQRKDRETVPIPPQYITFQRQEKRSRQYDRDFVDGASVSDLDIYLIQEAGSNICKGLSTEKILQHLDLAEYTLVGLKMKRAALLLFAKQLEEWHPRAQVRLLKVIGSELKSGVEYNATEVGLVRGNIFSIIIETWEKLRPFLVQTKLSSGAVFEIKTMYPELACQEAIINAVAHRDYSVEGRGIEIFIYDDRMEIKSPGLLLSTISVDSIKQLKGVHESRNVLVSRVLRDSGYMRELGEGMRRIFELFKKNELSPPEIISENESFTMILHQKSVYTTEQKLWLEEFKDDNLTSEEKPVVLLGYNNNVFSAQDIWDTLGLVDTEDYRKIVHSLQTKGILAGKYGNTDEAKKVAKTKKVPFRQFKRYYVVKPELRGEPRRTSMAIHKADLEPDYEKNRIYVANLPYATTVNDIYDIFGTVGNVIDVYFPINQETGLFRGFAFVAYESQKEVEAAIKKLNGSLVSGRRLAVSFAYKKKIRDL
jgi:ATP-dependent DNA helicase RecG